MVKYSAVSLVCQYFFGGFSHIGEIGVYNGDMATSANYPELAEQVKRVMRQRHWSISTADMSTHIGRATIDRMRHGSRPGPEKLIAWATYIEEPIEDWYRWAGYDALIDGPVPEPALPRIVPRGTVEQDDVEIEGHDTVTPELTREPVYESIIDAGWSDLDPETQAEMLEDIRRHAERDRRRREIERELDELRKKAGGAKQDGS